MKTRNYRLWSEQGMPRAMHQNWRWVSAVDAWDYCHPQPLADLVKSEQVPEELRPIIAAIINGDRSPNRKAAAKLKVSADERMQIAGSISAVLGLIDVFKFDAIDRNCPDMRGVSMVASTEHARGRQDRDPEEIMRELEGEARTIIADSAEQLGVSVETIENLLRDLRGKMERYPNI